MRNATKVCIVIVTFNRQGPLTLLLESLSGMHPPPASVIVVNNASTDETASILANWQSRPAGFLKSILNLETNSGGAGGFRAGMQAAIEQGIDWIWVMDDDVQVLPNSLELASKWMFLFEAFMGRRIDPNGSVVRWSHRLNNKTGLAPVFFRDPFKRTNSVESNSGCFEGMFISKKAVLQIGLPDSRFFITWDDAIYGWLLSQDFRVGYVKDAFLQRTMEMKSVGKKNLKVYSRNDLGRRYFIRNRAIVEKYFASRNKLNPFYFSFGNLWVIFVEILRVLLIERRLAGMKPIFLGLKELRQIRTDNSFNVPEL